MSEIRSGIYRPGRCCERCVFGREGEHAAWCEQGIGPAMAETRDVDHARRIWEREQRATRHAESD